MATLGRIAIVRPSLTRPLVARSQVRVYTCVCVCVNDAIGPFERFCIKEIGGDRTTLKAIHTLISGYSIYIE